MPFTPARGKSRRLRESSPKSAKRSPTLRICKRKPSKRSVTKGYLRTLSRLPLPRPSNSLPKPKTARLPALKPPATFHILSKNAKSPARRPRLTAAAPTKNHTWKTAKQQPRPMATAQLQMVINFVSLFFMLKCIFFFKSCLVQSHFPLFFFNERPKFVYFPCPLIQIRLFPPYKNFEVFTYLKQIHTIFRYYEK